MGTVPRPPHHGAQSCDFIDNALKEKFHVQQETEAARRTPPDEENQGLGSDPLRQWLGATRRAFARCSDRRLGRNPLR
jgi:hypothetical protein